nr:hypothetical protein [Tanacetum cinerariifolium]
LSRISDLLDTMVLSNMGDRRFSDFNGNGCFRVKNVRMMLDDMLLPKSDVPSRWVKQIPIKVSPISCLICCEALKNLDHLLLCCDLAKDIARSICNWWAWFGTMLIRTDLSYLGLIWFSFNQVRNRCWKECFTLPGGVSGHIETISYSLIQILEKMAFLKTELGVFFLGYVEAIGFD